jgi:glycosyltransferase involved in cell wall biosynthesis
MGIFQRYIDQQNNLYFECLDQPGIEAAIFVVIPCFNEPDILTTLTSLAKCTPPKAKVAVLVVVNDAENASQDAIAQNLLTLNSIAEWKDQHRYLFFDIQRIYAHALPDKWAGVGWARKIGMDNAVKQIDKQNFADGIIVCLDADCKVMPNYLRAIESAFNNNPANNFFTIHFEHLYDNNDLSAVIREGIIRYELHMRYYRNAMQWCGYHHAIHTVGSSFAVKASAYVKQGGMNRRKAGEDFYFLHKLVLLGSYGNIHSTTVFPAARNSDRVPFGTGAAMKKWSEGNSELYYTYSIEAFSILKPLFSMSAQIWNMNPFEISEFFETLHTSLKTFCENSETLKGLIELKENCSSTKSFEKRFFHLLNAFWILKYLNFAHETIIKRGKLQDEAANLLQNIGIQAGQNPSLESLLEIFRNLDRRVDICD